MNKYGVCLVCGSQLEPVLFTEKEEKLVDGHYIETGRYRINVDYLLCENCGHKEAVDGESFAGEWRY